MVPFDATGLRPRYGRCDVAGDVTMTLYVITGPPCSGKSRWVNERSTPADMVIDLDRIALAISGSGAVHHDYPRHIRQAAIRARGMAVPTAIGASRVADSYIIHAKPGREWRRRYALAGAEFVPLTAPLPELLDRAARERPPAVSRLIRSWWDDESAEGEY